MAKIQLLLLFSHMLFLHHIIIFMLPKGFPDSIPTITMPETPEFEMGDKCKESSTGQFLLWYCMRKIRIK